MTNGRSSRRYGITFGERSTTARRPDNTELEIDAVVEAADGRWAAFEIKLGVGYVEDAAANLLKFADRVDTSRTGEPAALAVITSTGYGYVREDGIGVIPFGALGP